LGHGGGLQLQAASFKLQEGGTPILVFEARNSRLRNSNEEASYKPQAQVNEPLLLAA
jgi:hypothetical protein